MRLRIGIRFFLFVFLKCRHQAALYLPEISGVVGKAVTARLKVRPGRDDIHLLGCQTLRLRQQIGIEAKLKNGAGFRFTGKLGVERLIRPITERAWPFDTTQYVGTPTPGMMRKRAVR
jgi:hypothetical protein